MRMARVEVIGTTGMSGKERTSGDRRRLSSSILTIRPDTFDLPERKSTTSRRGRPAALANVCTALDEASRLAHLDSTRGSALLAASVIA